MDLDAVILEELGRGEGTVKQIAERLSARVRPALDRLAERDKIVKKGFPGKGNEKIYSLPPIKRRI